MHEKSGRLFTVLSGFFLTNAIIAEFVGIKIFALEPTLGISPLNWRLFGQQGTLDFTAGVLLWPFVFVMTDVINEYFGRRGVRFISWLAAALIGYAFLFAYLAIGITPADWWVESYAGQGIVDAQAAFAGIFGQGLWVIGGSLTAFIIGQLLDVTIYHRVRRITGEGKIWLRATGSTLVSQFIDSFVVLYIAFVLGPQQWPLDQFLAVGTVNYIYKFCAAILMTPLIYLAHALIDRYLGAEAWKLKAAASADHGVW
ncbi:MAG: queuosine precursor transporter [Gammaproteobacteria bacterium]|nr:queuosine precursor transporter [Gammaproteobacteria bacterium]